LEKTFREKIAMFYKEFRAKKFSDHFPLSIAMASDLTLLLKYLSGRLHLSDFEIDFGIKGTASNMLNTLFETMGKSINFMSRPVDAIKHQAKTVTVGTSRISEKIEGILFDALSQFDLQVSQIVTHNVIVLKNLQGIISTIEGAILYKIGSLNLLGEPTDETTIEVIEKRGVLKPIPSRVETDPQLKGTKRIIVRKGNVYIGKGRKDNRSIVVIPVISASPSGPNIIQNLLLLNISFKKDSSLPVKIKALGGKYEHIKNIVQENSIPWKNDYLNLVDLEELFGRSAEKIAEFIVSNLN
jgi:glucosamine--fructose-6-phosphate aminotransferase (isomerizing)